MNMSLQIVMVFIALTASIYGEINKPVNKKNILDKEGAGVDYDQLKIKAYKYWDV